MQRTITHRVRVLGVSAVLGLTLTGCGLDQLAEEGAERAAEEAIEQGGNGEVDIDVDGEDGFKVESSDGSFEVGSTSMPDDFPTDSVPLVEGELVNTARMTEGEDTTWSVTLRVDQAPGEAYAAARGALESAGFTANQTTESDSYSNAVMEGNGFTVMVSSVPDSSEGGGVVSYQVSTASSQ